MEAGIDEAGRGPVIGPLVVGLVASADPLTIKRLGVRDSKVLTPTRREELNKDIRRIGQVETISVQAAELDERMGRHSLNRVEEDLFAELGRRVDANVYYLDACDVNEARFGQVFLQNLQRPPPPPRIVSEHKADARYPLVSAASIVAKVERDRAIREIARRLEPEVGLPLGSGYAHDPFTIAFLEKHLEIFGRLPAEARAKWETAVRLKQAREQRTLPGLE